MTPLRRGPYGRIVLALRGSRDACATLGLNARLARAALLAGSAGLAGLAAAFLGAVFDNPALLLLAAACGVTALVGGLPPVLPVPRRRTVPGEGEGLRVSGVTVRFGGLTVVDGAGLEAPPGTVTGLVGPSGAGKTTFFDVISGLRRPDGGTVRLDGADLTGGTTHERARRGMARTFQRPEAFGSLTVRENVLVAAEIHAMTRQTPGESGWRGWQRRRQSRRGASQVADRLLKVVGITEYADRRADTVPAGVARLLELARALATEPRLLLLDGPCSGLAVPEARALECLLRDLAAEGMAVVLVEDDLDLVIGVCDVLYVLDSGKVVSHGPPVEVRADLRAREACRGERAPA